MIFSAETEEMPDISDKTAAYHPHKLKAKEIDYFWNAYLPEHRRKQANSFASWKVVSSFHAFFGNEAGH